MSSTLVGISNLTNTNNNNHEQQQNKTKQEPQVSNVTQSTLIEKSETDHEVYFSKYVPLDRKLLKSKVNDFPFHCFLKTNSDNFLIRCGAKFSLLKPKQGVVKPYKTFEFKKQFKKGKTNYQVNGFIVVQLTE